MLTVPGATFAGRVAASLLHAVGLPELVDRIGVVQGAIDLATDSARLAAFRARLAGTSHDLLFDTDRYLRHLEAAYVTMWERQQRGQRPAGFAVPP